MGENDDKKLTIFNFEGAPYKTHLTDKFEKRSKWEPEDPLKIYAVIPGTILKISVKEGQRVNKGRALYILEAMKMKNRILSNVQGEVYKIHVEEGQKVAKNELIMEFRKIDGNKNSKNSYRRREKKT
jgi:biotin carboxyl carrier protein